MSKRVWAGGIHIMVIKSGALESINNEAWF